MATNYPGSLDTGTEQPSPLSTTEMDDAGFEHDVVHTNHSEAIIALETKVGVGSSSAVADSVLAGTGSGTSGWSTAPSLAGLTVDTDTLHVDATNDRVGIGTTTPAAELDVSASVTPQIQLTSEKNGTWVADDPFGEVNFYGSDTSGGGAGYRSRIRSVATDTFGYEGELAFHTTSSSLGDREVVRIDQSGRVGIGTTSPSHPLHVTGSDNRPIRAESSVSGSYIDIQDSATSGEGYVAVGAVGDEARFIAGGSTRMTIGSGGNVGIGTTSPVTDLHIASTDTSIYLQDTNGTVGGSMSAYVRMTDSAGSVQGAVGFVGTSSGAMVVDNNDGPLSLRVLSNDSLILLTNSANRQTIFGNGNISFHSGTLESDGTYANTTGSGANMHISSGGFFYRSTSSGKYKTDVETMEDSYADSILGLRPVWYRSLSEHDPDSWGYWGFIAEEVAEVDPRLVSFGVPDDYEWQYDEDDQKLEPDVADLTEPEGVQYDRMVPHLVNLLKRHEARIAALEAA